jgi:hypothetical protein
MTDGFSHTDSMLTSSEVGMAIQLSIDRFEGEQSNIAVLLSDAGQQIDFPRDLLPAGAQPGGVLSVTIERDLAATEALREETKTLQDDLSQRDPGGDLEL